MYKMIKKCQFCKKDFTIKNGTQKFCSNKCYLLYHSKQCLMCGKLTLNKIFCSNKCSTQYRYKMIMDKKSYLKKFIDSGKNTRFKKGHHPITEFKLGTKSTLGKHWKLSQKICGEISKRRTGVSLGPTTEKTKDKISRANIGKSNANPHGRGKSGHRKDLNNQYFRSRWEANFARICNFLEIEWEYEPCRFKFDDCSWLIDFYLPQFDMWVEVKGWMRDKTYKLFKKMRENYPNENVKILDGKSYKELTEKFKDKILEWE